MRRETEIEAFHKLRFYRGVTDRAATSFGSFFTASNEPSFESKRKSIGMKFDR